jgi:hypothetical protein
MRGFRSWFVGSRFRRTAIAGAFGIAGGLPALGAEVDSTSTPSVQAAPTEQPGADASQRLERFRWAVIGSAHAYREPQMRIVGPAIGLRAEAYVRAGEVPVRLEGELAAGVANYSSPESGTIEGFPRIGSMFHLQDAAIDENRWIPRPGIGISTEWTDLRGQSSLGKQGYERFNLALWLSATWDLEREREAGSTRLRAAFMVQGWQSSMLNQANPTYLNVINRQRRGALVSIERPFQVDETRWAARLSFRAVGRSDLVDAGQAPVYEPSNRTLELTLSIWQ